MKAIRTYFILSFFFLTFKGVLSCACLCKTEWRYRHVVHCSRSKLLDKSSSLIVGGANADRGKYPWQTLLYYNNQFRCGGSLLNDNFVLTAAHCVRDDILQKYGKFSIAAGKYKLKKRDASEQIRYVLKVHVHPNYQPSTDQNDIAILELEMPVVKTDQVNAVILATARFDLKATEWMDCYATGFGLITQDRPKLANALQELKTHFISKMKCKALAKDLFDARDTITKLTTCTKDEDAGVCNGDSGGPVGCFDVKGNYIQIGLLSWGSQYCPEGFNVFMRVSQYRQWIKSIAGRVTFKEPVIRVTGETVE